MVHNPGGDDCILGRGYQVISTSGFNGGAVPILRRQMGGSFPASLAGPFPKGRVQCNLISDDVTFLFDQL